jgi:hypothetical protein
MSAINGCVKRRGPRQLLRFRPIAETATRGTTFTVTGAGPMSGKKVAVGRELAGRVVWGGGITSFFS